MRLVRYSEVEYGWGYSFTTNQNRPFRASKDVCGLVLVPGKKDRG